MKWNLPPLAVLLALAPLGAAAQVDSAVQGAGGISIVTDGTTTTRSANTIDFTSGCTVTVTGGIAQIACSGSGGSVSGPGTTTSGYVPQWSNTGGTALGAGFAIGTGVATALGVAVGSAGAVVTNNAVAQSFTGGLRPTAYSNGTGSGSATITVDCGNGPLQTITNGGAFTLAMAAYDGECVVRITNNGSAGTISYSGFSEGSNTGDALDTTSGHAFDFALTMIGGTKPHYLVSALQ
jgi:hypothetical protein